MKAWAIGLRPKGFSQQLPSVVSVSVFAVVPLRLPFFVCLFSFLDWATTFISRARGSRCVGLNALLLFRERAAIFDKDIHPRMRSILSTGNGVVFSVPFSRRKFRDISPLFPSVYVKFILLYVPTKVRQ